MRSRHDEHLADGDRVERHERNHVTPDAHDLGFGAPRDDLAKAHLATIRVFLLRMAVADIGQGV